MKNIISHIGVNSAFLSWEAVYHIAHKGGKQDLSETPSTVGENMEFTTPLLYHFFERALKWQSYNTRAKYRMTTVSFKNGLPLFLKRMFAFYKCTVS